MAMTMKDSLPCSYQPGDIPSHLFGKTGRNNKLCTGIGKFPTGQHNNDRTE